MVGQLELTDYASEQMRMNVNLVGSVPRSEIEQHFKWADVFLLPSLCEGSATACYEALGYGLPVIATPNTGTVVRDGVEGFIVPVADEKAIADRLLELADCPHIFTRMSDSALKRAAEFSLEKYGERLLNALGVLDNAITESR
jgi:glycosyltransferase involved in cell wall biosynthesis